MKKGIKTNKLAATSVKPNPVLIEQLSLGIEETEKKIDSLKQELVDLKTRKMQEEIKPFKFGDEVVYTHTHGGRIVEDRGVLESPVQEDGSFGHFIRFRAYKKDGSLSNRTLNVYCFKENIRKA